MIIKQIKNLETEEINYALEWSTKDIELALNSLKPNKPVLYKQLVNFIISETKPKDINFVPNKYAGFVQKLRNYLKQRDSELEIIIINSHSPKVIYSPKCKKIIRDYFNWQNLAYECSPAYIKMKEICPECPYRLD